MYNTRRALWETATLSFLSVYCLSSSHVLYNAKYHPDVKRNFATRGNMLYILLFKSFFLSFAVYFIL